MPPPAASTPPGCSVGLLGTRFTMEQAFYRERLERSGLNVIVPDAAARERIHAIIYDELCRGVIREQSRAFYREAIAALVAQGAQGMILGCTEIALLVGTGRCAGAAVRHRAHPCRRRRRLGDGDPARRLHGQKRRSPDLGTRASQACRDDEEEVAGLSGSDRALSERFRERAADRDSVRTSFQAMLSGRDRRPAAIRGFRRLPRKIPPAILLRLRGAVFCPPCHFPEPARARIQSPRVGGWRSARSPCRPPRRWRQRWPPLSGGLPAAGGAGGRRRDDAGQPGWPPGGARGRRGRRGVGVGAAAAGDGGEMGGGGRGCASRSAVLHLPALPVLAGRAAADSLALRAGANFGPEDRCRFVSRKIAAGGLTEYIVHHLTHNTGRRWAVADVPSRLLG